MRRPGGSHAQMATPLSALSTPSAKNAHRQENCAAASAATILPLNPPKTVPAT